MKFIRYHGKVIPIHEKPGRIDAAGTSAISAGIGAGSVAGFSKLGSRSAGKEARLMKLAKKSTAQGEKAASVLEYAIKNKKATPKFTASTVDRITRNTTRGEKLLGKAAAHTLGKVAFRRASVIVGGIALGHALATGVHASTGQEPDATSRIGSHTIGISLAAVASGLLFKGKLPRAAKIKKVLSMVGK